MAAKYTLHELIGRLSATGWHLVTGNRAMPVDAPSAGWRRPPILGIPKAKLRDISKEIETEIEIGTLQLQELWHHLGLPVWCFSADD
jgi:hypothetical protein